MREAAATVGAHAEREHEAGRAGAGCIHGQRRDRRRLPADGAPIHRDRARPRTLRERMPPATAAAGAGTAVRMSERHNAEVRGA